MGTNKNNVTIGFALRIPIEVYDILERRAKKQDKLTSRYAADRLTYDTLRKHGRRE